MTERRCTHCGGTDLARGLFMTGAGQGIDWFPTPNAGSFLAKLKAPFGPHFRVDAYRCQTCSHLDLFVPDA